MAHTGRLSEERLAEIKEAALLATLRCEACDDDEGEYADCTCSEVGESGIAFIATAGSVAEVVAEVVSLREALAALNDYVWCCRAGLQTTACDKCPAREQLVPLVAELAGSGARKCGVCGKDPASGFASIGDTFYCHGDEDEEPTCYMRAQLAGAVVEGAAE